MGCTCCASPIVSSLSLHLLLTCSFFFFVHSQVQREAELEALEGIKVSEGLAAGKSPQELAMNGLPTAVEPAVL